MEGSPVRKEASASPERGTMQLKLAERLFPGITGSNAMFEWTENYNSPLSPSALFAEYEKRHPELDYTNLSDVQLDQILKGIEEIRNEWTGMGKVA